MKRVLLEALAPAPGARHSLCRKDAPLVGKIVLYETTAALGISLHRQGLGAESGRCFIGTVSLVVHQNCRPTINLCQTVLTRQYMEALLASLAGIAFSSLIASIGYWRKVKHETRKATKAALFYLLEIRHYSIKHIGAINHYADEYMAQAHSALKKEGIELPDSEYRLLTATCRDLFRMIATEKLDAVLEELMPPYYKALDELAKEDPLLAFNLRGRESLSKAAKATKFD